MRLLDCSHFAVNWQQLGDAVAGQRHAAAGTTWHRDITAAIRRIVENLSESLNVADLVAALPVGRRTLERRFRELLGMSIRQVDTRIRLEVARQMLVRTHLTIIEVSVEVGFASPSRMAHVFRRQLACSPQRYRQSHRPKRNGILSEKAIFVAGEQVYDAPGQLTGDDNG